MSRSRRASRLGAFLVVAAALVLVTGLSAPAATDESGAAEELATAQVPTEPLGHHPCVQGRAGPFACHQVDLLSFLPPSAYGGGPSSQYGGPGNVVEGWTDPDTGAEWALVGRANGTAFVDISDPKHPVYVANLPTQTGATLWRDVQVYADHAFVVSEASQHGMQVFDLTRLRMLDRDAAPVTVLPDAHYAGFGNAHTLFINEETGFAYPVGTGVNVRPGVPNVCSRSLHMVDVRDPKNPTYAGCYQERTDSFGYTHEVSCIVYHGPDERYQGHEICFLANPEPRNTNPGVHSTGLAGRVLVVDVTDKSNPVRLSWAFQGFPYGYSHQAWATDDHRYLLHQDEGDSLRSIGGQLVGGKTRMRIFDLSDLENLRLHSVYHGETGASAHNIYVKGRYAYLANYFDGLRIVDITGIDHPAAEPHPESPSAPDAAGLREVACFDVDPARNDIPGYGAAWDNYPYYRSGVVAVSGFDGFFLLKPRLGANAAAPPATGKNPPTGNAGGQSGGGVAACTGMRGGTGPTDPPHDPGH